MSYIKFLISLSPVLRILLKATNLLQKPSFSFLLITDILNRIKEILKGLKSSNLLLLRLLFKMLRAIYVASKFVVISSYRNQSLSLFWYKKYFHQVSHFTEPNRYPDLFEICRSYLKDNESPKILSFGCSTGEEVFSLGECLPSATIVGTDISKWCIKECHKKNVNRRFVFVHSKSEKFNSMDNFDAIFCLAVFQHSDNRKESIETATKYVFSQFEGQLIILNQKLKPAGLLFIDHCDFNFLETSISKYYSTLENENNKILRDRPLFNKNNYKISDVNYTYRVFRKK